MSEIEPELYFPNHDPRPFLSGQVSALREQAELVDPGGPHRTVNIFEQFCEGFIEGQFQAEVACLYSLIVYARNKDTLEGTEAGRILATFPENFSRYVHISDQTMQELHEDAETEAAAQLASM